MSSELIWEPLPPYLDLNTSGDGEQECWACYGNDHISCHGDVASPGAANALDSNACAGQDSVGAPDNAAAPGSPPTAGCSGNVVPMPGLGHSFTKKTFHKPIYCSFCTEMGWGMFGTTGYLCDGESASL